MNNGEDWREETYAEAEEAIGYRFHDRELLRTCFTHSTYRNNVDPSCEDNERLEFLGDAVLQFVVSDVLYRRKGEAREGKLTELRKGYVSKEALTPIADELSLMRFLRHSNNEKDLGGNRGKLRSSIFEAVVGGIYLDGGLDEAKRFLAKNLRYCDIKDHISELQRLAQSHDEHEPVYRFREGEERGRKYHIATTTVLGVTAEGRGASKQEARESAAEKLVEILKEREKH